MDGREYAVDEPRQTSFALVSASDGAIRTAEGVQGYELIPHCRNTSFMFGLSHCKIHRSKDGLTWTRIKNSPSNIISITSATRTIKVFGDVVSIYNQAGLTISVEGATTSDNNGNKTVFSATLNGDTTDIVIGDPCTDQAGTGGVVGLPIYSNVMVNTYLHTDGNGRLYAFLYGGISSPGTSPMDVSDTSTSIGDDGRGLLKLTKTGAFTSRSTGNIIYLCFSNQTDYANGFYRIQKIDNHNATLKTMSNADVAYITNSSSTWYYQIAYQATNSSGMVQLNRPGGFSSMWPTGTRIYVAFADNAAYKTGFYRYTYVNSSSCTLVSEDTGHPIAYEAGASSQYVAYVIGVSCLYSTDNGESFACSTTFKPSNALTICPYPAPHINYWGFWAHGNTVMVGEYSRSFEINGRYVHRSQDGGVTWKQVLDMNDISPYKGEHIHTIGYHSATNQWIAAWGDIKYAGIAVSADDGDTWTKIIGSGNCVTQPICFVDTGDPTRILAACDTPDSVSWLNLDTGYPEYVFDKTDPFPSRHFFFTIHRHESIYYAGGFDPVSSGYAPCLFLSSDLKNWSVYHKFTTVDRVHGFGCKFAGFAGGKLHYWIQGDTLSTFKHFVISPAEVRNVDGILIEPAMTNRRDSEDLSSFEDSTDFTSATATISRAADPFVGNHATRVVIHDSVDADHTILSGALPEMISGKTYVVSFRIKSVIPVVFRVYLYKESLGRAYNSLRTIQSMAFQTWNPIQSSPFPISTTASDYKVMIYIEKMTDPVELYIDTLQLQELPLTEWQIGGTAKAVDVFTATVSTPSAWTDLFAVQTIGLHTQYAGTTNQYIKTWKTDSDNHLQLFYNPLDSRFYLQRRMGGIAQPCVGSTPQEWHPNQVIKFSLRMDSSGITLDIQNGRPPERITDGAADALVQAAITMIYGDASSNNPFPGRYVDGTMSGAREAGMGMFPFVLSDAEVAAALNLAPPATRRIDMETFSGLAKHWLQSPCAAPDWCEGADRTFDGSVDFDDVLDLVNVWLNQAPF